MSQKTLIQIFAKHLKLKKNIHKAKLGIGNWDSLTHLNIVMDIEANYKIKLNINEIQKTANFKQFEELLKRK